MSYQSFYLCHYGKPGMKWGYNDGKRNGKEVARGPMIVPGSTRNLQGLASRGINTYTRAKTQSQILRRSMGTRHRLQTGLASRNVSARGTTGVPDTMKVGNVVSKKRNELRKKMDKKIWKGEKNVRDISSKAKKSIEKGVKNSLSKVKKAKNRYEEEAQQRRAKKALMNWAEESKKEREKKNTKKISNRVSVEFEEAGLGSGKQQKKKKKTYDNSLSSKARKVKDRIDKKITENQRGRTTWEVGEAQLGSGKQQKKTKKTSSRNISSKIAKAADKTLERSDTYKDLKKRKQKFDRNVNDVKEAYGAVKRLKKSYDKGGLSGAYREAERISNENEKKLRKKKKR